MLTILIRTVIVYVILLCIMRLMGKRQLGELEISELVTTLLLSEIASLPIENQSIPLVYAIIPLVTILTFEVTLSIILVKCPRLKNLASARPSVLIRHGFLDQKELRRIRISLDELISEVRQSGLSSLDEVDYAILEQNGKISIIPKKSAQPPTAKDMHLAPAENGIVHTMVADGKINRYNLQLLQLGNGWVDERLQAQGWGLEEVFFLGIDDSGKLYWIKKGAEE